MKRLLLIGLSLLLFGIANAQSEGSGRGSEWISRPSEKEVWNVGLVYSAEYYLNQLVSVCGVREFYNVLDLIEDGSIDAYIQSLIEKENACSKEYIEAISDIRWMDKNKTCFVADSVFYIMTYEPAEGRPTTRKVFLFGRNHEEWFKASDEIREDYYIYEVADKQFKINAFNYPPSRYWIQDNKIVLVTETVEAVKNVPISYNTITTFVPKGDKTYDVAYFEPIEKTLFDVNQVHITSDAKGLTLKYEFLTIEFKIVGNDLILDSNKFKRIR